MCCILFQDLNLNTSILQYTHSVLFIEEAVRLSSNSCYVMAATAIMDSFVKMSLQNYKDVITLH